MQAEASSSSSSKPSTRTKQDTPCRYYLRSGKCKRGDKCIFSHDATRDQVQPVTESSTLPARLSVQAADFASGSASRSSLSASAQAFQPTTRAVSDDDEKNGEARKDVVREPQISSSTMRAAKEKKIMKGVPASISENTQPCDICMEVPNVYAQHPNCNHFFCPPCLQQWRRQHDQAKSKNCPTCRTPSKFTFVTPEPFTGGARSLALERFRERAAQTPCKQFTKSLALSNKRPTKPFCVFGDDCLYQHHIDGQPHKFGTGRYRIHRGKRGTRRIIGLREEPGRFLNPELRARVRVLDEHERRALPTDTTNNEFFARILNMDEQVRMFLSTRVILNAGNQGSAH
ncbi:hypothetical protein EX895_006239 [Sporisorium graminicola]|uniref:Uncharacterized protein n=1 Tax=Sporisorium graminicola TaxID=280036 RepID=A0A4V6ET49_9BASI|nr:hypothetical protein EX895_006239 [Sporisorium graminicola]TKY85159.1 hypothetical protein EX895_006239 [Sporisorium graminicola]